MAPEKKDPSGLRNYPYLFKGGSRNSLRVRSLDAESKVEESSLSQTALSRLRRKQTRVQDCTVKNLPTKGLFDWDGKTMVYLDGSGLGLPEMAEKEPGCQIIDARKPELLLMSDSATIVKDVCCLLPSSETRDVFTGKSFSALEQAEKSARSTTSSRGKKRLPQGTSKYMVVGTHASRNGRGIASGLGSLKRSPTAHKEFSRILRKIEHRSARWIDTLDLKSVTEAKKRAQYPGFIYSGGRGQSRIWPSVATGRNTFLPLHIDKDYFLGAVTVCGKRVPDTVILQYFCFPTMGIHVGLRHGDVLLFNPTVPHCISSTTSTPNVLNDCFSFSAYLKTLVVSGNSNL